MSVAGYKQTQNNTQTQEEVQKTRFDDGMLQQDILSDYLKRENDWRVRQQVILPFVLKRGLGSFNMMTLPCTAPIWEMNLRSEPAIKHVDMNAILVEYDQKKHNMLQESLHKNFSGTIIENLRKSRGGTEDEYNLQFEVLPPMPIQQAISLYNLLPDVPTVDMIYADFCGCWSDQHLSLFKAISDADCTSEEFILGITTDLTKRVEAAGACQKIRSQILNVGSSHFADGVTPFFATNTADPNGNEILTGARKASHIVHKNLRKFEVKLKYAGVYRRASQTKYNEQMATLWYQCKKK